jgi:hypothetical protein
MGGPYPVGGLCWGGSACNPGAVGVLAGGEISFFQKLLTSHSTFILFLYQQSLASVSWLHPHTKGTGR